jgi:enamine deaminase RidA (YjgF/YER057c/UK114 family)
MVERQFIQPEGLARPGAYTPVVATRGGRTIYVSGQIAHDENDRLVGAGDLRAQAEQCFRNVAAALEGAGASFLDVVKLNLYVVDYKPEYRALLHEVRARYVSKDNPPASTLVGVQALARPGLLIEVEAIAVAD